MNEPLFSDEERQQLILALIEGEGARGVTQAETIIFLQWCEEVAVAATMVELLLLGEVLPFKHEDGHYRFTAKGEKN